MKSTVRIGTRDSRLALYQARQVELALHAKGIETTIIEIKGEGDADLETPLYEMGIQGIFTRTLDTALLNNRIDVAVHSAKDVPTKLAKGLSLSATLPRGSSWDCLVLPAGKKEIDLSITHLIATSSLRRQAQWAHRYPSHTFSNLRGNIQTRLAKLDNSDWSGAIFAQVALERLNIDGYKTILLDWMLPAPAQGAIAIACRENDEQITEVCKAIHHEPTGICIRIERDFLAALHGGCSVPIGAHAVLKRDEIQFRGNLFTIDGKKKLEVVFTFDTNQASHAGYHAAQEIIKQGGEEIINTFRKFY